MTPYGEAAMVRELEEFTVAGEGDRNNRLNKAAYTLGQLIGKGHVDEAELEVRLRDAAVSLGLTPAEADATIRSGIRTGRKDPRGPEPGEAKAPGKVKSTSLVLHKPGESDWKPVPTGFAPGDPWQAKAAGLVAYAQTALHQTPSAISWLAKRGISETMARAWALGWLHGEGGKDMFRSRESWGLPPEVREDGSDKPLWIPRGLVIPWRGLDGVHRIRIRRPEGEPRYYVIAGSLMDCYMLPRHTQARIYIIVESELDAIMLDNQVSDFAGIVALGNSTRKPDSSVWSALSAAAVVLVSLDSDDAGRKATRWYLERLPRAKDFQAPVGKDPGEAYQSGVDIREWVLSGLPAGLRMDTGRAWTVGSKMMMEGGGGA